MDIIAGVFADPIISTSWRRAVKTPMRFPLLCVQAGLILVFVSTLLIGTSPAVAQMPTPPFTQCPPTGLDTSCRILIVITPTGGQQVLTDPNVSPTYDGNDDTLIGIVNLSANPLPSLPLTSTGPIFGFDGDGICAVYIITPNPPGCPFGPTGYEGPGVSYGSINAYETSGTVIFTPALAAKGGSTYFGLEQAIPTQCPDADGDGLCDDWEKYGLTVYDSNGNPIFVDLPSMGADPNHKDIFVQADYMDSSSLCLPIIGCLLGHTHKPKPQAIAIMTQAFENAPVNNPDGTTGIHLHVDCGSDCIMNPLTGQTWGALSQAHALTHTDLIGSTNGNDYVWSDFDALRSANFSVARNQVFHYVVFAHDLGGLVGVSGISRGIPSADLIVSLGSWTNQTGTTLEQGGTFMHELGHNLSLQHGGTDGINYKPNFLSVMNYAFQTTGLIVNGNQGTFDYSRFQLPSLDESALNENVGLNGGAALATYGTMRTCPGQTNLMLVAAANGPIDWNCDGKIEASVSADINQDGQRTVLTTYNDWPNLVFTGGAIGGLGLSLTPPALTLIQQELTPALDARTPKPYKVMVSAQGSAQAFPGQSTTLSFTVANKGTKSDVYALTANSSTTWASLSGIPTTLSLDAGKSQTYPIDVVVPANTPTGTPGDFSLRAVSQANPAIEDTGYAEVTTKIPTSITLASNPSSGFKHGQSLTVTATVKATSGNGVPTGTVTLSLPAGMPEVTIPLGPNGQAIYKGVVPAPGKYTLYGTYNSDANYASSVSTPMPAVVSGP